MKQRFLKIKFLVSGSGVCQSHELQLRLLLDSVIESSDDIHTSGTCRNL